MTIPEPVLGDVAPVFRNFWYDVDGELRKAPADCFVSDLKELWGAKEIRVPTPLQIREHVKWS